MNAQHKTIVLVGGGTGGSVSPLLAVKDAIKEQSPKVKFIFIGSGSGPEAVMAAGERVEFIPVWSGKLRRYFSLKNILTPFQVIFAFVQSLFILRRIRASCVFGTGSFVQVPVMWAAWLLRIPVVLHQQDIYPSLSNTLCAPIAQKITVTFERSLYDFPQGLSMLKMNKRSKTEWTGNPCRISPKLPTREQGLKFFGLDPEFPTVLIMGGGTGALAINALVEGARPELEKSLNVIHITGKGKGAQAREPHYFATEFLSEMHMAYAASDIVISRAGVGSLTELSVLGKPSIIIPMPNSHQELNAELVRYFGAALIVPQSSLTTENFTGGIRKVLFNKEFLDMVSKNIRHIMPHGSAGKIAKIILNIVEEYGT